MTTMNAEARALVLVVDDDDDSRGLVREILMMDGYSVVEATNGKKALEFLVANQGQVPSLILLDLEMPIMTGWEFVELVKNYRRLSRIQVLIASGSKPQPDAKTHGAIVSFLQKPYDVDELRAKITSCTRLSFPPAKAT